MTRTAASRVPERERSRRIATAPAQRLLEAARVSVYRNGVAGTRLADVAAEAGQARGSPHYYFGGKGRLMVEVVRADHQQRVGDLEAAFDGADSLLQTVEACVAGKRSFVQRGAGRSPYDVLDETRRAVVGDQEASTLLASFSQEYLHVMTGLLHRQGERDIIALAGADAETAAVLLISMGQAVGANSARGSAWEARALELAGGVARHLLSAS